MDVGQVIIYLCTLGVVATLHGWVLPLLGKYPRLHLVLYSVLWAVLLFVIMLLPIPYQISNETFLIFSLAWVFVYLGHISSCIIGREKTTHDSVILLENYNLQHLRIALFLLVSLSLLGNVMFYKNVLNNLSSLEALVSLRTTEGQELIAESSGFVFNVFGRIYVLYVPLALILLQQKALSKWWVMLIILIAAATSAGSLTRAPVLFLAVIVFVSVYTLRIKIPRWAVLSAAAAFIALLWYTTSQIALLQGETDSSSIFLDTVKLYFLGSLVAFDGLMHGHYVDTNIYDVSLYSFDFINYFIKKIGLISTYPSLVRPYAPALETNVYTYLDAFALDFGITGIIIGAFIVGVLSGIIALRIGKKINLVVLSLFCYWCYGLSFSHVNNEFIRSYVVIIFVLALLIHYACKTKATLK